MSKPSKSTTAEDFESHLQALETLVERLEHGEIPLAEAMSTFEEGLKRARSCESLLAAAQARLNELGSEPDATAGEGS